MNPEPHASVQYTQPFNDCLPNTYSTGKISARPPQLAIFFRKFARGDAVYFVIVILLMLILPVASIAAERRPLAPHCPRPCLSPRKMVRLLGSRNTAPSRWLPTSLPASVHGGRDIRHSRPVCVPHTQRTRIRKPLHGTPGHLQHRSYGLGIARRNRRRPLLRA